MTKDEIRQYIDEALTLNAETAFVEFKDSRGGFPKKPVHQTLSAFGNVQGGGVIVFGIQEDEERKMRAVGLTDLSNIQERMTELASQDMNTEMRLDYHTFRIQGEHVLGVYVSECKNDDKPYYCKKLGLPRGAYVRDGNTDRQMTENEMRSYVRNAQIDNFDSECADDVSRDDLSLEKVEDFLRKSAEKTGREFNGIDDNVLKNIGLVNVCDEVLRPTIAGYLIFAKEKPQNKLQFERYKIRCVRYKGSGVSSDILDKADFIGTLDEQIDLMHSFVLRNIKNSAQIIGTKRVEKYEYPEKAIREIVANAVIHRDYRITETYTQVNIFEDRIEVFNPGNLPPGVTIENIKTSQVSRNKIIAARLNEMDYMEEYGRGIGIVISNMSEWGLLPPIFKNTSNSFRVILPGEKLSQLNERQLSIWQYLVDHGRVTRKGLEELLPDVPQATLRSDLVKMKKIGLLNQMGQASNTYYEGSF